MEGGTTICIASLDPYSPTLYTIQLGDTKYMLLRRGNKQIDNIFTSIEQQVKFGTTCQLSQKHRAAKEAIPMQHFLQPNDIILMATDGFFDNMDEDIIYKCIWPFWMLDDQPDMDIIC